jgi:phosphate:Na+ symporter
MFQTVINILGILIFYPILKPFSKWLEKRYSDHTNSVTVHINRLVLNDPETALVAVEKESERLIKHVIWLNRKALEIRSSQPKEFIHQLSGSSYTECYETIKQLNGEILDFCISLKSQPLNETELERVDMLIQMFQKIMISAKSVKDIRHNIKDYRDSANDLLYDFFKSIKKREEPFYDKCEQLFLDHETSRSTLKLLIAEARNEQNKSVQEIFNLSFANKLQDLDMATLINVFEAVRGSHESLLEAMSLLKSSSTFD